MYSQSNHTLVALTCAQILALAGCSGIPALSARKTDVKSPPVALNAPQHDALGRPQPGHPTITPAGATTESSPEISTETRSHVALAMGELLESNKDFKGAQAKYEQALKLDPDSLKAALALARVYARMGRPDAAMKVYHQAEKQHRRSAAVHNDKGLLLAEQRNWQAAIVALRTAVKLEPTESKYHNNLGMILANTGAYDEALQEFREAVGPGPAHYNLAVMLLQAGRHAEARSHLDRALTAFPTLKEALALRAQLEYDTPRSVAPANLEDVPLDLEASSPAPASDVKPDVSPPAEIAPASADAAAAADEQAAPEAEPSATKEFHADPWSRPWAPPKWLRAPPVEQSSFDPQ